MFSIHLPPVRERKDNLPELLQSLLIKLNRKLNKHISKKEVGVIEMLKTYSWLGNIRELENTLIQATIFTHGDVLKKKNIPSFHHTAQTNEPARPKPINFHVRSGKGSH